MSSFLCFLCHSTVNADTNEDIREKYRDVVGMHLCMDSHLCYICCHVLNKLWLFRAVCLKRSLEYPVLFSEKGTLNLQRNDLEIQSICPDEVCGQFLNSYINSKVFRISYDDDTNSNSQGCDNEYVKLTADDKTDVDEYFQKEALPPKDNILEKKAESFNEFLNYSPDKKDDPGEIYNNYSAVNQNVDRSVFVEDSTDHYIETESNGGEDNVEISQVLTGKDEFIAGTCISIDMITNPQPAENKKVVKTRRPKKNRKKGFEKIILSVDEQKTELDKRRRESKYLGAEFKCHSCALGFLFKDSHQTHMMRHEESNGEHLCRMCSLRFASVHVLKNHLAHHRERYRCYTCDELVPPRARPTHARRCWSEGGEGVACHLCGGMFQDQAGLQQHLRRFHQSKASNRSYPCSVCGNTFRNQATCRNHMLTHMDKKFECNECSSTFSNPYTLAQHKKTKHSDDPPQLFYCELCHISYGSRKSLLAHKRNSLNHQQTIYSCPMCARECGGSRALAAHMESVHSTNKNYVCELCPNRYTNRKSLVRHMNMHQGKIQPKTVVCHVCAKHFSGTSKLNRHLREVCEKSKLEEQLASLYA